jgi:hypothetical protein
MNQKKTLILASLTVIVLAAGVWLSLQRSREQANLGGTEVFADLEKSLGEIGEIRLSKGDGSRATLRKGAEGWQVVERNYAADGARVRELALALANLRVVERKTRDPANYAKLGVEPTDAPSSTGTLVEVVAGERTWSLIVGKAAEGRALYVRKPKEDVSLLVTPFVAVDPDQKRWIDRRIVDLPGSGVHEIAVKTGEAQPYLLRRQSRSDADLVLTSVPKGRQPASAVVLGGQAEALNAFNFDDVRPLPEPPPVTADSATYRFFDGQVIEFSGRRDGEKAYITVKASRDAALAAKFAPPPASAVPAAKPADNGAEAKTSAVPEPPAAPDRTAERLSARAAGLEFEIPVYKYEAIFKPLEQLLEPRQ